MSDSTPDSVPEAKNPYANQGSVRIIEPANPLPDLTLDSYAPAIQDVIRANGWSDLMLVQKKASPYILNAQDIIVQSKTGSGKTGAFVLPLLQVIEKSHRAPQVLIMTPTRELALQVFEECVKFGQPLGIDCVAVYGGVTGAVGDETPAGVVAAARDRWGDVPVLAIGPGDDPRAVLADAEGHPLWVVTRDAHRHTWMASALDEVLSARPDAVVIDTGWPGWRPADGTALVVTHGASRVSGAAVVELLGR